MGVGMMGYCRVWYWNQVYILYLYTTNSSLYGVDEGGVSGVSYGGEVCGCIGVWGVSIDYANGT